MGRPRAITPEIAAAVEALRQPGMTLAALHAALEADGHRVSKATLYRFERGDYEAPTPEAKQATAALASDDLGRLRDASAAVARAMQRWAPSLGRDPRAVRAYQALVRVQRDVTAAIIELTPRPPEQRYQPIEGAALEALRARALTGVRVDAGLRDQVVAQAAAISRLTDALASAGGK